MKRLIIMRHAKTEPWTEGVDDHARAVVPDGHDAVQKVALNLESLNWSPDSVFVSSARRARETWLGLKERFPGCEVLVDDSLYLASVLRLEEVLLENTSSGTIMLIGHNPGLHDLGISLLRHGRNHQPDSEALLFSKLPTGAAALFEAATDAPFSRAAFSLRHFIRPKDLRDGAAHS
ncbi:MAG: SixA phosphatase family protein [Henriciella sp.]